MKTKETLDQLKIRLEKIEALKSVGINFKKKRFSKSAQEFVRSEIQAFLDRRIQEIDDGAEIKAEVAPQSPLSNNEVTALKSLAARVLNRAAEPQPETQSNEISEEAPEPKAQDPVGTQVVTTPAPPLSEALRMNAQLQQKKNKVTFARQTGRAIYKGQDVEVVAKVGNTAVIRGTDGNKIKVSIGELH